MRPPSRPGGGEREREAEGERVTRSTVEERDPRRTSARPFPGEEREEGRGRDSAPARGIPPWLVSTLLHDLNAPLQTVIGFSELLLERGAAGGDAASARREASGHGRGEFLERIRGAGWEMARLLRATATLWDPADAGVAGGSGTSVEALLAVAAAEAGEGEPGPDPSVRLDVGEGLPPIVGRADRLTQALRYLIEAAAGEDDGEDRTVTARVRARAPDIADVVVEIRGPGTEGDRPATELLPERVEDAGRVPEARERRRRLERVAARHILEAGGGALSLEDDAAGGRGFRVVLPGVGSEP